MSDPLSITAAVLALVTAAVQVSKILHTISSKAKDAPKMADSALREVKQFSTAIHAVDKLIQNVEAAQEGRISLIEVDTVVVTLTDAVLTFSEFQRILQELGDLSDFKAKLKWGRTEGTIDKLTAKIRGHTSSLSLMLNIIQW
jgi:hypothetical protein